MTRTWQKRGLLISAPPDQPWASSHAALPAPARISDEQIEVYYSPRDERGRAHITHDRVCSITSEARLVLAAQGSKPALSPGPLGAFDDAGVTASCVVESNGATYLYYTGWSLGVSVPFYLHVGLAIRAPGGVRFERVSDAPILERSVVDPFLTASPWVIRERGGWRMWYVAGVGWEVVDGRPRHRYHIRYAESDDGIDWRREGRVSIDFASDGEYAISRPCVVRDGDSFRMWFAARGVSYRLGYAESPDGLAWSRDDRAAGIEPSEEGWDDEMLAYPAVIDLGERRYLLYNGNDYGRTGIGYAVAG